jgi:inner membrane protein
MDNICHTLVGAAMAHAGLRRRTAYASATLMLAANIPDLDALSYVARSVVDVSPVAFRRGWTHGVVGQALLPIGLTLVVVAWARWRGRAGKSRDTSEGPPLRPGWLLVLSYLALYSHLFLDFLNNYGVRLLAPLEWRWFYGDAVFIVDPWLWLALGLGVRLSRRWRTPQPALMALGAAIGYVLVMLGSAAISRQAVIREFRAERGYEPSALMVGPVPVSPFSHQVIIDAGDHYETGTYRFWSPRLRLDRARIPKNDHMPAVAAARAAPAVADFLVWSRFPFWQVRPTARGTEVIVRDARFPIGDGTFMSRVVVSPGGEIEEN